MRSSPTRAVVQVPGLQKLMHYICKQGFKHHVALNETVSSIRNRFQIG